MRIAVTGAQGLLGSNLVEILASDHQVIQIKREDVDLSCVQTLAPLTFYRPDCIIHTAAYTDVDGCELDPEMAYRVNALGTKHVVEACKALDIPLVYISTDYVFDGQKREPYTEADAPNPINVYGSSKLAGEGFIRSIWGRSYIVRTAGLYGRHGRNFVTTILQKVRRREALRVVHDQVASPTYSRDLAKAIACLVRGAPFGTYHLVNSGSCSWYEFARTIVTLTGLQGYDLAPITSQELGRPAPRPAYSVLASHNWSAITGEGLRSWQDALAEALSEGL